MKEITERMIKDFKIMKLGFDFMAYSVDKKSSLSFHHTIISHKKCLKNGLGHGYWKWNGSILVQDNSHDYLHRIEKVDTEVFYAITSELVDMNIKGFLDVENLRYINDILCSFEREHCGDRTKKGKVLIKEQFVKRVKV